jgi:hypothetical protein
MPQHVMTRPSKVVPAWLLGVLVAGSLDLADALLVHGVRGVPPVRVLQSIAVGLDHHDLARSDTECLEPALDRVGLPQREGTAAGPDAPRGRHRRVPRGPAVSALSASLAA